MKHTPRCLKEKLLSGDPKCRACFPLTKAQAKELHALLVAPRGRFGFARVRVQNTLIRMDLARVRRRVSQPTEPYGSANCDEIEITDLGRQVLE